MTSTGEAGSQGAVGSRQPLARPSNRTTFQFLGSARADGSPSESLSRAKADIVRWAKRKVPGRLPDGAIDGQSFSLFWPGQKLEAIDVPSDGIWALRLEHPDSPFRGQPAVAGRTWTTDVAIKATTTGFDIGIRTFCTSMPYVNAEPAMVRPAIVRILQKSIGVFEARQILAEPWKLMNEGEVDNLHVFVRDPRRSLPVVVLTQPDKRRMTVEVDEYVLDPVDLAERLAGLAHVVQLPWELSYRWTDLIGKEWSTYLGAVRTYFPGFDPERDDSSNHPCAYAEKIVFWKNPWSDHMGEDAFEDFLVDRLSRFSANRRIDWDGIAFISQARVLSLMEARKNATDDADWRQLYDDEIASLQAKNKELENDNDQYCVMYEETNRERVQLKEENRQLRFQADSLRMALNERRQDSAAPEVQIPESYDAMSEWAKDHLLGRVVLHPRAFRGLKGADYADVEGVYKALLLLANEYRDQAIGKEGAQSKTQRRLEELDLRLAPSISAERAGEQGDDYFIRFPTSAIQPRFLDMHLRKGTSKETRYCLAIYFLWDADSQQVVVGWLPSHLDNRMT